jgi:hypothetical protein
MGGEHPDAGSVGGGRNGDKALLEVAAAGEMAGRRLEVGCTRNALHLPQPLNTSRIIERVLYYGFWGHVLTREVAGTVRVVYLLKW